ncbi:MAG TPA: HAMP domain-containing sensor histidine kinase, partial [Abditibacterium sp.]
TEFSSIVKPPAPHPEVFDLARLVRDITRELQGENLIGRDIAVDDALPDALWAHGDMIQTRQALRHVVANAAEAMEEGGLLQFSSVVEDGQTRICIEDSGTGLEDVDLERVFQPFFSTKPASTGLGLSIARGLLRASGGDLMLETPPSAERTQPAQRGARVKVHLPHPAAAAQSN